MKIIVTVFLFGLLAASLPATAQTQPSPEAEAFFSKAMSQINRKHVSWVKSTASEVNEKSLTPDDVMTKTRTYAALGNMGNADIEALAFLVLMQASKSAQEDLKAIMAKVKAVNEHKEQLYDASNRLKTSRAISGVQLDSFNLLLSRTKALRQGQNPETVKLTRSAVPGRAVTKQQMDATMERIKNDLDSMSEMGEMESLRLQMAMDRMSKLMSTLSNILKKISATQDAIVQNLK